MVSSRGIYSRCVRLAHHVLLIVVFACNRVFASADVLLVNGVVHTMNPDGIVAEAVAINGGRIIAVGSNREILLHRTESTNVVDLDGKPLFPGFTDAHVHVLSGGSTLLDLSFTDLDDAASIQAKVLQYAAENPELEFIVGRGWSLKQFAEGNPHKQILDEAISDRPVILTDSNHHSVWVNSRAIELAGINAATADPLNGKIERDKAGEPTGTLRETAMAMVYRLIPADSVSEKQQRIKLGVAHLHSLGYTAFLAAAVNQSDDAAWMNLSPKAHAHLVLLPQSLPLHAEKQVELIPAVLDELRHRRQMLKEGGITASHVKIFLDGGLESCSAAFLKHYADANCGQAHRKQLNFPKAFLAAYTKALDHNEFSIHVHSIGDLTTRTALDVLPAHTSQRHGIAHLQFVHPDDYTRFNASGTSAVIQSLWAYPYDESMLPFDGTEIASSRYPFNSLAEARADLVTGSDWPVSTANPLHALEVAVLRRDPEVAGGETWLPKQTLTVDQFMRALTINGAKYLGQEVLRGSIEVGKQADLVSLSNDPYKVDAAQLSDICVESTMFNGEFVFQRQSTEPCQIR